MKEASGFSWLRVSYWAVDAPTMVPTWLLQLALAGLLATAYQRGGRR